MIKGFKSKAGKKFDAYLVLKEDNSVGFEFDNSASEKSESEVVCPKCSKKLMKDQRAYSCDCGFKFFYVIAKKPLSDKEVSELIIKGRTDDKVTGLSSKSGNLFDTVLTYKDDRVSFDFNLLPVVKP